MGRLLTLEGVLTFEGVEYLFLYFSTQFIVFSSDQIPMLRLYAVSNTCVEVELVTLEFFARARMAPALEGGLVEAFFLSESSVEVEVAGD